MVAETSGQKQRVMAAKEKHGKPASNRSKKPVVALVRVSSGDDEDDASVVSKAGADDAAVLRRKDLFDKVMDATGAKKRDVKLIVEATLKVLGDSLSAGENLALAPLGNAKVTRRKNLGLAETLTIRLKRTTATGDRPGIPEDQGD